MARKKSDKQKEYLQLELIPLTEIEQIKKEFDEVKESASKVRKGMFKRHSELAKKIEDLSCQLTSLQNQMLLLSKHVDNTLTMCAKIAQSAQVEESPKITYLVGTKACAMYADVSLTSLNHGISNIQISKSA